MPGSSFTIQEPAANGQPETGNKTMPTESRHALYFFVFAIVSVVLLIIITALSGAILQKIGTMETSTALPYSGKLPPVKPNFIVLMADDMGYGDLRSYGHTVQEHTPIDDMAAEGILFRQFYSGDCLCTPSRAAFMTARLPVRSGLILKDGTPRSVHRVFSPTDTQGLLKEEVTIAEALRDIGYSTGMIGKWHLGINAYTHDDGQHLPMHHGFDYVGINMPWSNHWACDETGVFVKQPDPKFCFLYNGSKIIQQPINKEKLTKNLVDDFKAFVDRNLKKPFFFFLSFPQIHTDVFHSKKFENSSFRGLYGDSLNEMAWAVGEVLHKLKVEKLDKNTLVVFISDHGPHVEMCQLGGVTAGLKGGKGNMYEGGFRIPGIAWWPGTIKAGQVSNAVISAMDLYPTFVDIAGGSMPRNLTFDGEAVTDALLGFKPATSPDKAIYFYCGKKLMAIRYRDHKVHFYTLPVASKKDITSRCPGGMPLATWFMAETCNDNETIKHDPPEVYDLLLDPYEMYPLDITADHRAFDWVQDATEEARRHEADVHTTHHKPILGYQNDAVRPCCDYPKLKT